MIYFFDSQDLYQNLIQFILFILSNFLRFLCLYERCLNEDHVGYWKDHK